MTRLYRSCWIFLLLLFTGCQMQDTYGGKLILKGDHELASGSTLDGDLALLGGSFTQHAGSTITGSIHIIGGQAELAGTVAGSVTLLDGGLVLAPQAAVHGDLNILGGALTQSPQARIDGEQTFRQPDNPPNAPLPIPSTAGRYAILLIEVPLLALVGYLAARFYAGQVRVLHAALTQHTLVCTATGLLAMIAGLSLAILMAYTMLLIPAGFLLLALMLFATTFGAVPVAIWLGNWAVRRVRSTPLADTQAAVLGMVLLAALSELLRLIPFIGDLLMIALLLTFFGAVLLTRFGSQVFVADSQTLRTESRGVTQDPSRSGGRR